MAIIGQPVARPTKSRGDSEPEVDSATLNDLQGFDWNSLPIGSGIVVQTTTRRSYKGATSAQSNVQGALRKAALAAMLARGLCDAEGMGDGFRVASAATPTVATRDASGMWTVEAWIGKATV